MIIRKLHPLRQKRFEQGLSQYLVAFETGIPQVRISYAERWFPALTTKQKIKLAEYFNTTVSDLFPGKDLEGGC